LCTVIFFADFPVMMLGQPAWFVNETF
jgi:hypothetical protein